MITTRRGSRLNRAQKGFTIIELTIATGVFTTILLLLTAAVTEVGNMFFKASIVNRTQSTMRSVIDDISGSIQFGNDATFSTKTKDYNGVNVTSFCLGNTRYSFAPNTVSEGNQSGQIPHVLWKDRQSSGGTCVPADLTQANPPGGTSGQELLSNNMRVTNLVIVSPTPPNNLWRVDLTVAYGSTADLFVAGSNFNTCVSKKQGGQYCSVSTATTYVTRRI